MKFAEFEENLKRVYAESFPESLVSVQKWSVFGKSVMIRCYIAANRQEEICSYFENDMFHITMDIALPDNFNFEEDELPESMGVKKMASSYAIKPDNDYMAYGARKISKRMPGGSAEKVIQSFGKYVAEVKKMVQEDLQNGNIHENHLALVEKKVA